MNGFKVKKVAMLLKLADIIIFSHGSELKAIKVLILAKQRGSPFTAVDFYEDLSDILLSDLNKVLTVQSTTSSKSEGLQNN